MRLASALILIVVAFVVTGIGQKRDASNRAPRPKTTCRSGQVLVDRDNPVAFLTFVKKERIETETRRGSSADYLFFTLTNNYCGPIWIEMSGEDKRLGDASLYVEVQDIQSGKILHGALECHHCSINPLGPGRALTFSVPLEYAGQSSVMKIAFDFGWERDAMVDGVGVQHTVGFYFKNLPETVLPR